MSSRAKTAEHKSKSKAMDSTDDEPPGKSAAAASASSVPGLVYLPESAIYIVGDLPANKNLDGIKVAFVRLFLFLCVSFMFLWLGR